MFVNNHFIYIQMQKTACTHIAKLLSELFDGKMIGKHNSASQSQIAKTPYFISSIRNPWDWYLSMYTHGVLGKGGPYERLTQRHILKAIRLNLVSPRKSYASLYFELIKDIEKWQGYYQQSFDATSFQAWLTEVLNPQNAPFLGEQYGQGHIAKNVGFMTYRYFYLCCKNTNQLRQKQTWDYQELVTFDKKNSYIDNFIRQEHLEDSLFKAIKDIPGFSKERFAKVIKTGRTNESIRAGSLQTYYTDELISLVHRRDRLLIEKFGYSYP